MVFLKERPGAPLCGMAQRMWYKVAGPPTSTNLLVEVLYNTSGDPVLDRYRHSLYNSGLFKEKVSHIDTIRVWPIL